MPIGTFAAQEAANAASAAAAQEAGAASAQAAATGSAAAAASAQAAGQAAAAAAVSQALAQQAQEAQSGTTTAIAVFTTTQGRETLPCSAPSAGQTSVTCTGHGGQRATRVAGLGGVCVRPDYPAGRGTGARWWDGNWTVCEQ